ncbi:MAG TPA: GAF domain-containing sensor histidine kinase, partial [Longimicrobium sp.]|nr:GAF domain-containing sensor histidine kinase [Longimicrobium sp.]
SQLTLALRLTALAHAAREAAVAVERERSVRERAAELVRANEALRRFADRVAARGGPGGLDGVLREIALAVGPADTTVYLRDPLSGALRLHSFALGEACGCHPAQAGMRWRSYEPMAAGFLDRLLAADPHAAVFALRAGDADPRWAEERAAMAAMGYQGAVSVVMRTGGEVMGMLTVGLRGRAGLGVEEVELLRSLANQAALVVLLTRLGDRAREEARQSAVLEERNRIAREIHDTIAQGLSGIIFGLEGTVRGAEVPDALRRQIGSALEVARGSLAEARRSLWALRPVPLAAEGLESALRRLVEQHRDGAAELALEVAGGGAPLADAETELGLLRVAREAVSNALRHAGAARVVVRLEQAEEGVRLSVADDGRGFDPEALAPGQSFGITGMRERAARAGGALEIESAPGRGTVVSVRVAHPPSS